MFERVLFGDFKKMKRGLVFLLGYFKDQITKISITGKFINIRGNLSRTYNVVSINSCVNGKWNILQTVNLILQNTTLQ